MKLQTKISIYLSGGLLAVGLSVATLIGVRTGEDMLTQATGQMAGQVAQMTGMLDSYRLQNERLASDQLTAFSQFVTGEWRLASDEQIATGGKNFPALKLNGRAVNNDVTLPDRFTQIYGSVATIFVRAGDDFHRVTTSLKKEDGQRAVGTALGSAHPAHAGLLKGEAYVGKARLFGRDYMTKYQPIKGERGDVIGAMFIGVDFTDSLAALKESIKSIRVGEAGYFYAIDVGNGTTRGNFVIHRSQEGKSAFELKDLRSGENFLQKAAESNDGVIEYTWDDPKRGRVTKYSIYRTYAPWQLQFHISADADEFLAPGKEAGLHIALAMLVAAVLMATLAIGMVSRLVLRPLGGEPSDAADLAAHIAGGDLTHSIDAPAGSLLGSLAVMQQKLREVFAEVITSAGDIAGRSESVATSSREIGQAAHSQAESTSASAANIEELTVSISEVSHIAQSTEGNSAKVAEISERGVALVTDAANEISAVRDTVAASSEQIRLLQQRSQEIGGIAGVIKEIADQTNLLALNAAIEAARAGEQGRGFAVVADEVRKLAERTGAATTDIARMIDAIQDETIQAVAGMDRAGPQVEKGMAMAREAATVLEEIHTQAVDSLNRVRDVANATAQQVSTATDIAQHVEHIASMAEETNAAMQSNAEAAMEMDRIATSLREHISRFRV